LGGVVEGGGLGRVLLVLLVRDWRKISGLRTSKAHSVGSRFDLGITKLLDNRTLGVRRMLSSDYLHLRLQTVLCCRHSDQ